MKKLTAVAAFILSTSAFSNPISGDIVGRDLKIPGGSVIGHVGMATGDWLGEYTLLIIEALNQTPAIVINYFSDFKSRSAYWGSRNGVVPYTDKRLKAALVEMNHQRWWCPSYTDTTQIEVGSGNLTTGQAFKCGIWRCDMIIEYSMGISGIPGFMTNGQQYPMVTWRKFPYMSTTSLIPDEMPKSKEFRALELLTEEEIEEMDAIAYQQVVDIPFKQQYEAHYQAEWRIAKSPNLGDYKRGIVIDRIGMQEGDNVISRLIELYNGEQNEVIKKKTLQGLMIHYQKYNENLTEKERAELKRFYQQVLDEDTSSSSDMAVRGWIDFHDISEIENNLDWLDAKSENIERNMLLGLRYALMFKSKKMEKTYLPKIIDMINQDGHEDLQDMFFGMIKMGYKSLRSDDSRSLIRSFAMERRDIIKSCLATGKVNPYTAVASMSLDEFINSI